MVVKLSLVDALGSDWKFDPYVQENAADPTSYQSARMSYQSYAKHRGKVQEGV
jgi:hypothetical protein